MNTIVKYHPVIENLVTLIKKNNWEERFETAIKAANSKNVPILSEITDIDKCLSWLDKFLYWVPTENSSGHNVDDHLCVLYFIANQESLSSLQNKIAPNDKIQQSTEFSQWLVDYANAMGLFLDTPESFTEASEKTFYQSVFYNMKEYVRPHGGWGSFNQFFARHFKPGNRPIAAICDQSIIVMPADSTYIGQWEIRKDSQVTVKKLNWTISQLLEGSPFKDRFDNGIFMHAYLGPTDYHRQHAPVGGKVLEARVIQGQVYLEVVAMPVDSNATEHTIKHRRNFDTPDTLGYQFAQSRGLIVLDTAIGLVAVLPIGMCQVSSVVMTAEVGVTVRKGEELSYFQFGGSDVILLFESSSNVCFTAQPNTHYKIGTKIGEAYPVI